MIIAQRGSRSRTETTALEPIRTVRPTNPSSAKPVADARSMKIFALKRRLSRSIPSSSPSRRAVCTENRERGRQSVIARSERIRVSASSLPSRSLNFRASFASSTARTSPDGVSTSTARSAGSAETGFNPGAMLSASAKLAGFAALSGWRKRGR